MKRLMTVVFALALAASASAAPGKVKARYSGTVESYDTATKTLTIAQKERKGVFVITDTSEVLQGKTKADPSAFVAGRKVKVEFVMDGATKLIQKAEVSGDAARQ